MIKTYSFEPRDFEGHNEFTDRAMNIINWCTENLGSRPSKKWEVFDRERRAIYTCGGYSVYSISCIAFADPEVATIVALKFGL